MQKYQNAFYFIKLKNPAEAGFLVLYPMTIRLQLVQIYQYVNFYIYCIHLHKNQHKLNYKK